MRVIYGIKIDEDYDKFDLTDIDKTLVHLGREFGDFNESSLFTIFGIEIPVKTSPVCLYDIREEERALVTKDIKDKLLKCIRKTHPKYYYFAFQLWICTGSMCHPP